MSRWRLYLVCLAAFLAADAVWLGLVAGPFYSERIGFLLAEEVNWVAAGVFYLIFVAGIQLFVIEPGLVGGRRRPTLLRAAFFGVVTYATYDLTNLATVAGWPLSVTVVDLAWGATVATLVTLAGFAYGRRQSTGGGKP